MNAVVKYRRISLKTSLTEKTHSSVLNKKGIMLNVKKETIDERFGIENLKNIENSAFL